MTKHIKLTAGDDVIVRYGNADGARGKVAKIYRDPPSIDVAIHPFDAALKQDYNVSPDGFVHLRLLPGEFEVFKSTILLPISTRNVDVN